MCVYVCVCVILVFHTSTLFSDRMRTGVPLNLKIPDIPRLFFSDCSRLIVCKTGIESMGVWVYRCVGVWVCVWRCVCVCVELCVCLHLGSCVGVMFVYHPFTQGAKVCVKF